MIKYYEHIIQTHYELVSEIMSNLSAYKITNIAKITVSLVKRTNDWTRMET